MDRSKLSQHKKIGDTLYTPFTAFLGSHMKETSWSRDKLPQFIWIALVFSALGRNDTFKVMSNIIRELKKQQICIAELSEVLSLKEQDQKNGLIL